MSHDPIFTASKAVKYFMAQVSIEFKEIPQEAFLEAITTFHSNPSSVTALAVFESIADILIDSDWLDIEDLPHNLELAYEESKKLRDMTHKRDAAIKSFKSMIIENYDGVSYADYHNVFDKPHGSTVEVEAKGFLLPWSDEPVIAVICKTDKGFIAGVDGVVWSKDFFSDVNLCVEQSIVMLNSYLDTIG